MKKRLKNSQIKKQTAHVLEEKSDKIINIDPEILAL